MSAFENPEDLEREELKEFLRDHNVSFYKSTKSTTLHSLYLQEVEALGGKVKPATPQKGKRKGTPNRSSKQSAKKSAKASTDETVPYWITQLTPKQLIAQLREYGSDKVAPCTASTRGLLELRLSKLIWADVDKPNDSDAGEDEDEDEEEPPAKVVPTPRASARKRVSQKKARPAAAATAAAAEDPLGDAHLMSDDDSAAAPTKAAPTMAVATPHAKLKADHDGTLLCNMFLVAVIVILVIAFLVATLD